MTAGRRVYIIGFMGSGKSTAGRKLASSLGWKFIDLDKEVERIAGQSVKEIFSTLGEDHFRETEANVLFGLITEDDTVISAGGGTPCRGSNMDFMTATGIVVYLKMTPSQLNSRLEGSSVSRPLLNNLAGDELLEYISHKLAEREEYYLKAQIITDGISLDIKALSKKVESTLL